MTSNLPRTPETPSHTSPGASDLPPKPVTSPADTHSMPTPARSINGSMSSINHDMPSEALPSDDSSLKRKRDVEDQGDQEQKKMHVEKPEDHKVTIADLSEDVGELYLFCKAPHPARLPPLSQDLFERYNLTDIAKSVARTNPDGSKGVKLRKTYKNHIKDHGLVGSFDAVKKELGAPDTLYAMMLAPAEEWEAEFKRGKEIDQGIPDSLLPPGNKVFTMARGAIPKNVWDSSVLGEVAAPARTDPTKAGQSGTRPALAQGAVARPVKGTSKGDIHRPQRSKKRSYGDSSFEGYAEGYVDDDPQDTGYSTGDGDDRGGSRKKLKKKASSQAFGGPMRQNSYGPGMVGAYN